MRMVNMPPTTFCKPAARQGDTIVEPGGPNTIAMGETTVLIG